MAATASLHTGTCLRCGATFQGYIRAFRPMLKYCSWECRIAAKETRQPFVCEHCGKPFVASYTKQRQVIRYCSRACQIAAMPAKVPCVCEECGATFLIWPSHMGKRRYCSKVCAGKHSALVELRPKRAIKACQHCGESLGDKQRAHRSRFCSHRCAQRYRRQRERVGTFRAEGGDYGPNWGQQRRNARMRDAYACQRCGVTEEELGRQLDVHHITPFRVFGIERYKEANRVANLVSLCIPCHKAEEHRSREQWSLTNPALRPPDWTPVRP